MIEPLLHDVGMKNVMIQFRIRKNFRWSLAALQ